MSVNAFGSSGTRTSSTSGPTITQLISTFLRLDGGNKATGNLDLNSKKIANLTTPTNSSDAENNAYADKKLPLTGGTISGGLTVSGGALTASNGNILMGSGREVMTDRGPSDANSLCIKNYVDTEDALKADKTYVDTEDALKADKAYVDTQNASKADEAYVGTQVALKATRLM